MWILGSHDDMIGIRLAETRLLKAQTNGGGNLEAARKHLSKCMKIMQDHIQTMLFGPQALSVHVRKIQSTSGQKGKIDSFFKPIKRVVSQQPSIGKGCVGCGRITKLDAGGVCAPCADHKCFNCGVHVADRGPCASCSHSIELRRKAVAASTMSDIEDLRRQAAEAKAKCDKCRGYSDEVEIKCVQKDCPNLYRRATLAARIRQLCR